MPAQGESNVSDLGLSQVRTKSGEVIGLKLDSSQQHARTARVKLSVKCDLGYQVRTKSGWSSDSSQQHVRTLGVNLSPTCELHYQVWTKSGKSSDSSQQHARTGGVKLSVTCELDYLRFGLRQVRM